MTNQNKKAFERRRIKAIRTGLSDIVDAAQFVRGFVEEGKSQVISKAGQEKEFANVNQRTLFAEYEEGGVRYQIKINILPPYKK